MLAGAGGAGFCAGFAGDSLYSGGAVGRGRVILRADHASGKRATEYGGGQQAGLQPKIEFGHAHIVTSFFIVNSRYTAPSGTLPLVGGSESCSLPITRRRRRSRAR